VTRCEPPHLLEAQAIGELEGSGAWRLFSSPLGTAILYSWDVATTRAWMNRIGPLAAPGVRLESRPRYAPGRSQACQATRRDADRLR
jgi:hypothetical protein